MSMTHRNQCVAKRAFFSVLDDITQTPREEGHEAFHSGAAESDNPYRPGGRDALEWAAGWTEAYHQDQGGAAFDAITAALPIYNPVALCDCTADDVATYMETEPGPHTVDGFKRWLSADLAQLL